jgi:hypothetical protein|tara:strand:+ start:21439 stop:21654 length:216 start_codon:yes stop_codon:yes gene_type:complete
MVGGLNPLPFYLGVIMPYRIKGSIYKKGKLLFVDGDVISDDDIEKYKLDPDDDCFTKLVVKKKEAAKSESK